jgi:hypothetical protein
MPANNNEYIALFGSVTRVMKAEKALKREGISFTLIPSPRTIPSPCGLAIRFEEVDREAIERTLEGKKLKITHLYLKTEAGYEKIY